MSKINKFGNGIGRKETIPIAGSSGLFMKKVPLFKPASIKMNVSRNNPIKMNPIFGAAPIPQRKKDRRWPQIAPGLNPFGDADRDGVINMFDCRPFDRRRQEDFEGVDAGPTSKIVYKKLSPQRVKRREEIAERKELLRKRAEEMSELVQARMTRKGLKEQAQKLEKEKTAAYREEHPARGYVVEKGEKILKRFEDIRMKPTKTQMKEAKKVGKAVTGAIGAFMSVEGLQSPGAPISVLRVGKKGAVKTGGGRGRPRGTLDPRYAKYGGVYQYRKAIAAAKRKMKVDIAREQLKREFAMERAKLRQQIAQEAQRPVQMQQQPQQLQEQQMPIMEQQIRPLPQMRRPMPYPQPPQKKSFLSRVMNGFTAGMIGPKPTSELPPETTAPMPGGNPWFLKTRYRMNFGDNFAKREEANGNMLQYDRTRNILQTPQTVTIAKVKQPISQLDQTRIADKPTKEQEDIYLEYA